MIYYAFSDYLKQRYGEKVYKLPIGLPLTCPNRDGSCGKFGCTFCGSIGAGYENLPPELSVTEQIRMNKAHIVPKYKAKKFIPYFQNFSNTYMPPEQLEKYVLEACASDDIVAIYIATRPDCINDVYLEILARIAKEKNIDICVELGLQTINYKTLEKINRGHGLAEYIDAVLRIKRYGLLCCTHVILDLPWDDDKDMIETARVISALGVDQVKLHALYIVKNTKMAQQYENKEFEIISCEHYKQRVIDFLEHLSPNIVLQRLIGRAPAENTLFSNWQTGWWKIRDEIVKEMEEELGAGNKKPEILEKLAQYELTLKDWVEAHRGYRKYVTLTGKCWPAFQTQFGFVPCYVNSRLTAQGIPVSCEVDIYGTLSEFIGQVVSDDIVTLLDINNSVPKDMYKESIEGKFDYTLQDTFMGFHCGNTASSKLAFCEMKYQMIMARSLPIEVTNGTLDRKSVV